GNERGWRALFVGPPKRVCLANRQTRQASGLRSHEQNKLDDFPYKLPPTQRVGLVWPRPHRPALILLFAKKFSRAWLL
ncbi:MAG: hypothetical protein DMF00_15380, partial [Verrucomicrobia bacterium]